MVEEMVRVRREVGRVGGGSGEKGEESGRTMVVGVGAMEGIPAREMEEDERGSRVLVRSGPGNASAMLVGGSKDAMRGPEEGVSRGTSRGAAVGAGIEVVLGAGGVVDERDGEVFVSVSPCASSVAPWSGAFVVAWEPSCCCCPSLVPPFRKRPPFRPFVARE